MPQQIAAAGEGAEKLLVEVVAVGEHDHCGILHRRVQDHPAGVEGHRQTLAGSLRVPHDTHPPVTGVAARPGAGFVTAGRLRGLVHPRRAQCFVDGDIHRVKLVITRHFLGELAITRVFEHDEVAQQVEEAALVEYAFEYDLQFREIGRCVFAPADRAPRLEPFLAGGDRADPRLDAIGSQ